MKSLKYLITLTRESDLAQNYVSIIVNRIKKVQIRYSDEGYNVALKNLEVRLKQTS